MIFPRLIEFFDYNKLSVDVWRTAWAAIAKFWNDQDSGVVPFTSISYGLTNQTKTASYTLTTSDMVIFADSTSAVVTITLPTAVGINGRVYFIKRVSTGKNMVKISPSGSETIDGGTVYYLGAQYHSVCLMSNNSNWMILF